MAISKKFRNVSKSCHRRPFVPCLCTGFPRGIATADAAFPSWPSIAFVVALDAFLGLAATDAPHRACTNVIALIFGLRAINHHQIDLLPTLSTAAIPWDFHGS